MLRWSVGRVVTTPVSMPWLIGCSTSCVIVAVAAGLSAPPPGRADRTAVAGLTARLEDSGGGSLDRMLASLGFAFDQSDW